MRKTRDQSVEKWGQKDLGQEYGKPLPAELH